MNFYTSIIAFLNANPMVMYLLTIWTVIWKGLALWKSAQRQEKIWFVVLLIVNTFGLLEILYLFVFSRYLKPAKEKKEEKEEKGTNLY